MILTQQQNDDLDEALGSLEEALDMFPSMLEVAAIKTRLANMIKEISEILDDATIEQDSTDDYA